MCDGESDACLRCGPGQSWNEFDRRCSSAGNPVLNCQYYSARSVCSQCNDNFVMSNNVCISCINNCKTCTTNPTRCDVCMTGWGHTSATAMDCGLPCLVPNCQQCADGNANQCKLCAQGFRIGTLGLCERCTLTGCASCQLNIASCDLVGTTNPCLDGRFFYNNTCQSCSDGCQRCDQNGLCLACNTTAGKWMWMNMECQNCNLWPLAIGLVQFVLFYNVFGY